LKQHKVCLNCHFLVKQYPGDNGKRITLHLLPQERAAALRDDFSFAEHFSLGCAKGVWDEGYRFENSEKHRTVTQVKRDNCFFLPLQEGMTMRTAEILQERRDATGEANKLRLYTVYGLLIAAISFTFGFLVDHYQAFTDGVNIIRSWLGL
jgi:hypothetical protein